MNRQVSSDDFQPSPQSSSWSHFLATQKGRKVMKTANSFKVTILCGFTTFLVLRGTMQAGSILPDGTMDSEVELVRIRSLARARMLTQMEGDDTDAGVEEVTSNESMQQKCLNPCNKPYTLGPKISNWDGQRRIWNDLNPGMNKTRDRRPKTLLVSGSQPGPCGNPMGDFYHLKFLKNRIDYARLHGLEIFYNMAIFDKKMTSFWAKLPLLRKLMVHNPDVEWIWWMDSDAIFTDMFFVLPIEKYEGKNLIVHGFHNLLFEEHRWNALNTGSFLLRNCQWSLDLLDAWAPFGPRGEVRVKAGQMLTTRLVGRPNFEADDQSALVYLLLFDDTKWKLKTHIEWEFYLHGYWKYIVYNYEDLMSKSHPGFGDHRWPFVTHFVGCKPCQQAVTADLDECLAQMERAFNFADNQVLEKYGFKHRSLGSFKTKRFRQDTSDPLGTLQLHSLKAS